MDRQPGGSYSGVVGAGRFIALRYTIHDILVGVEITGEPRGGQHTPEPFNHRVKVEATASILQLISGTSEEARDERKEGCQQRGRFRRQGGIDLDGGELLLALLRFR